MFPILLEKNANLEKRVSALEESGGGGAGVEPLKITLRGSELNPFSGTVTGATASEIESAYSKTSIRAVGTVGDTDLEIELTNRWESNNAVYYTGTSVIYYNNVFVLVNFYVFTDSMTFSSNIFTLTELS